MMHSQQRAQEGRRRMTISRNSFVESRFTVNSLSCKLSDFYRKFPSNVEFHTLSSTFVSSSVESRGQYIITLKFFSHVIYIREFRIYPKDVGYPFPDHSLDFVTFDSSTFQNVHVQFV
jgi:hypothetical protein